MGADSFLLYYGVRLPVQPSEIESLEREDHPSLAAAEQHGLDTWWGSFSSDGDDLFVGRELAVLGAEYDDYRAITMAELRDVSEETAAKLRTAGFLDSPALWAQWEPDF